MKLSQRLKTVAGFVPEGSRIADIGTDHGYVPIWLAEQQVAVHGIAMDVRKGPLLRAQEHIRQHHLEGQIETRLSDGLTALEPGEADTVIIAGMGGELMLGILKAGSHVRDSVTRFILSPQSELEQFRRGLDRLGLVIRKETILCEEGKYYTVMVAAHGIPQQQEAYQYRYGAYLIREASPVFREYLEKERRQLLQIQDRLTGLDTEEADIRRAEVTRSLKQIKEAFDAMQ